MDRTYRPVMTQEFEKALATLRTCPFSRLTQKQAEAVIAVLASREEPSDSNYFGWSFSQEMDEFARILPFSVSAFNAIDRDADEVVSKEDFDEWLQNPRLEHRKEVGQWGSAGVGEVESSLLAHCRRRLDAPDGLHGLMSNIGALNFKDGLRTTLSLREFVHLSMRVIVEAKKADSTP
mmetsp:Transcript_110331/g.329925  ORF Transcript_110331/g.329925 Transcript_110331/m.329925 type:complete len:178 (+) Transcript_110331:98-631(+)